MKSAMLIVSLYDIDIHAQKFMKDNRIEYGLAVPQSIADCWQFFMCEYDEKSLPDFVDVRNDIDPHTMIGYGLSKKDADKIAEWMQSEL